MPQQNQHAAKLNHAQEISGVALPSVAEAAEVLQPGEQSLDLAAPDAAPQRVEWRPAVGIRTPPTLASSVKRRTNAAGILVEIAKITMDAEMKHRYKDNGAPAAGGLLRALVWLLFAAIFVAVYFASLFSPPLLDDVDAAHAQAAQHMAETRRL